MIKNLKNLKTEEWIAIMLLLVVVVVVVGRYTYFSPIGNNLTSQIRGIIIKNVNTRYIKSTQEKNAYITKELILKVNHDGKWDLYEGNTLSHDYIAERKDGKIVIKAISSVSDVAHDIIIDNVRGYFTRTGYVITDVPYETADDYFYVSEQEDLFPIFGYHNVLEREEDIVDPRLDIRKADFENQVKFFNDRMNCKWYQLEDIVENYMLKERKLPRNTCVMTFDDGRKNNFDVVLPILSKYDIKASFYIIVARLGQKSYMTDWDLSSLFRSGHGVGSHSKSGGSLIDTTEWFGNEQFTNEDLLDQVEGSKEIFNSYGYDVGIFAYPLGHWDETIISAVQAAGYSAARATQKGDTWRDSRALAISMDENFIWLLNYYKPELKYTEEIYGDTSYNGWWQFEEGFATTHDDNNNIRTLRITGLTKQSYGVVLLENAGDSISNSFILENEGLHTIFIFGTSKNSEGDDFTIKVDGKELKVEKDLSEECISHKEDVYCNYSVTVHLSDGVHIFDVLNKVGGKMGLDRFRIERRVPIQDSYNIKIREITPKLSIAE